MRVCNLFSAFRSVDSESMLLKKKIMSDKVGRYIKQKQVVQMYKKWRKTCVYVQCKRISYIAMPYF